MKDFVAIVLAAGEGTRMKSNLPKVLHSICGAPMIDFVVGNLEKLHLKKICVVVNKQHKPLLEYLAKNKRIKTVFQRKPQGTADAVNSAKTFLSKSKSNVLVICADVPLIKKETLQELINKHIEEKSSCTILTTFLDNPFGFGRIVRDQYSKACKIIEENDASLFQKQIKEINSGIYCFKSQDLLRALSSVKMNAQKKEYYLTDAVEILYKENKAIETYICNDSDEVLGINSRIDLVKAGEIMRARINENFLNKGVTILDPKTTFINVGASIGESTVINPFTIIESQVKIGDNCSVGPFCHLRDGTTVDDNSIVGNFTEIVRSSISKGTFFKHFGYLGDAKIGQKVNIGAGTTIANFDGVKKNQTVIKDNASIGCDTVIVAPAVIGKGVVTGAGAVVTKGSNIKDGTTIAGVPARPLTKDRLKKQKKNRS